MKKLRQRGELALTLSLIGIFISLVGIGLGTQLSRDIQQSSSQASGSTYTYKSTLEIRDEKGTVLQWEEGMTWSSNLKDSNIPEKSAGDVKMPNDSKAHVIYDATGPSGVPSAVQNFAATITVSVPEGYEIVKSFCEDRVGTSCAGVRTSSGQLARVIPNIRITNGAEIVYGIIVRKVGTKPTSCRIKTPECKPQNLRFDQVSEHNITVKWDNPDSCTPYIYDQDRFWIDVIRPGEQGSADQIVCATDSGDEEATCTLGKAVPAGREIDTTSQEFTTKKWDQNRTYTLNVYLHNNADSCLSDPAGVSFSYTSKPPKPTVTPSPTDEPATPTPTAEPTVTTTQQPTAKLTVAPTTQPTKAPSDDTATVRIKVNYNGLYSLSSKEKHQFYIESCDDNNGTAVNCGTASNKKTGMVTLIKSDATKRFYGMTLQNVPVGKKRIVIRHLIDGKESRILRVSTTQCNSHNGSQYECPLELTKDQAKDIYFDVFFKTTVPEPTPQTCKHLKGNGHYRIAIVGQGYNDSLLLEQLAQSAIRNIQETNLSDEDLFNKMTFVQYPKLDHDMFCHRSPTVRRMIGCDYEEAIKIRSSCGAQALITIINDQEWGGGGAPKNAIVTEGSISAVAHELGHSVANLADEYVYTNEGIYLPHGKYPGDQGYNCTYADDTSCKKWSDPGECLIGCAYKKSRRQMSESIMRGISSIYPPAGIESWKAVLNGDKKFDATEREEMYHQSLVVELEQSRINDLKLTSIDLMSLYPSEIDAQIFDYTVEILSKENEILYDDTIASTQYDLHEYQGPGELLTNLTLYLPVIKDASQLIISSKDKQPVIKMDISAYDQEADEASQNLCSNSYCDAILGETATSCRADCGAHLAYSELERADIDGNGVVNGLDLAMVIDTNAYQLSSEGDIDGDLKTNALDYTLLLKWLGTETN